MACFSILQDAIYNNLSDLPQNEKEKMLSALFATNWNKSKAAEKLRWSRMTLYRKMAKRNVIN